MLPYDYSTIANTKYNPAHRKNRTLPKKNTKIAPLIVVMCMSSFCVFYLNWKISNSILFLNDSIQFIHVLTTLCTYGASLEAVNAWRI